MKRVFSAMLLFLLSLPVIAATQEAAAEPPPIEPLGTGYLLLLGVISLVVFIVFWRHYGRWDKEEDESDPKK